MSAMTCIVKTGKFYRLMTSITLYFKSENSRRTFIGIICIRTREKMSLWQMEVLIHGRCYSWFMWDLYGWKIMCIMMQVSKKNLMEIVKKLMVHMDKAEGTTYRDELLSKIIQICSQNNYQYITNFEWWVLNLSPEACNCVTDAYTTV